MSESLPVAPDNAMSALNSDAGATSSASKRQLGFAVAVAIVVGESIGLGVLLTPAAMTKSLGSPLLLLLVWAGMGAMALCGALCYAELSIRFPESGGDYVYLRKGFGDRIAFLYGWMSTIVMYPGVAAALAVGTGAYIEHIVAMPPGLRLLAPALLILAFGAINIVGTRVSGALLSFLTVLKLAILFGLIVLGLFSGHAHLHNLLPFAARRPGSEALLPAIAGAAMAAFFSFGGWWEAGKIAGEVKNPSRTLPLAFLCGVSLVTAVYLLITCVFLALLPIGSTDSSPAFVAQFGQLLFGDSGARILSICVVLCVSGGMAALMMAAPRVCFSMAQSGSFPAIFGKTNERWKTPANAILLQTGLALAVLLLGAFDRMLAYIIFSAVIFLALTVCVLFRLSPPVHAWWYPAAPILFIVFSAVIALLILAHDPVPALIGVVLVLVGLPLQRFLARM